MSKGIYKRTKNSNGWTEERREKYRKMFSGENNPFYGKKHTEENLKKMYRGKGKDNCNWKGDKRIKKTLEDLEKIAGRKRPEQCEICGALGIMNFDHDHETGEFRGWICNRCNLVLGMVKDNRELLNDLIKYLGEL